MSGVSCRGFRAEFSRGGGSCRAEPVARLVSSRTGLAGRSGDWHHPGMDVTITNDPARIAALRVKMWERRPADPLERFFRELPEKYGFDKAELVTLRERRVEAVPRLLEIARRSGLREREGAVAMLALCVLEEPAVLEIAREALRASGEAAPCRITLMGDEGRFLGTDPEICRMLLEGLDSPDPRRAKTAVQECGILALPGAVERFVELLPKPGAPDRPRIAFWIGELDPTPANLEAIGAAWIDGPKDEKDSHWHLHWYLCTVAKLALKGSPEVHRAGVEVLLRWLHDVRDGVRPIGDTVWIDGAFRALRRAASEDPRCTAMAVELVRARRLSQNWHVAAALDVIAVGDRSRHRSICLDLLQGPDDDAAIAAARSLGVAWIGTGDEEIVAAIRAARVQHKNKTREAYNEALARIGGSMGDAAAEDGLEAASGGTRMRLLWRTRRIDLHAALARMASLCALKDVDGLVKVASEASWPEREFEPAGVFLEVLKRAGVKLGFDPEACVIPPPYDKLILGLAGATRGRFEVEAADQAWDLPPGVSVEDLYEDEELFSESGYFVEFLHDGWLARFRASYRGDWYDVEAVMAAFNEALRASGRAERFHYLNLDQDADYVLLSPEAAKVAREEFFLPVEGLSRVR